MEILELERETLNEEPKYCHVLCCHPTITLCGAYKPIKCGMNLINPEGNLLERICSVCRQEICPDCLNLAYYPCRMPGCDH